MRQDVITANNDVANPISKKDDAILIEHPRFDGRIFHASLASWTTGLVCVAACLVPTGCQLTAPMQAPRNDAPINSSASSLKPQSSSTSSTSTAGANPSSTGKPNATPAVPVSIAPNAIIPQRSAPAQTVGASATIRGQSPDTWNSNTAGSGDTFRSPMQATEPSQFNRYNPPQSTALNSLPPPTAAAPTTLYQPQVPAPPGYGYGAPGAYPQGGYTQGGYPQGPSPSDYNSTIAPGAFQGPTTVDATLAPGVVPYVDPDIGITAPGMGGYAPRERIAPIDVFVQEARTGRIIVGGSVNSDLGVAGQIVIDERNFNIRRFPRSWNDLWSGRAFRGGGQNFRAEIMPGTNVERYTVSWTERNLFGYMPYSLSVGGFLYTRQFRDWTEQRLGGRVALGYEVTKDLSISSELRMEDVKIFDPRLNGVQELDDALGSNDIYTARFRLAHDTRDSPFMSTEGGLLELIFDQVFGEYDFSRGAVNYSRYFLVRERADGTGRHTIASTWKFGITGSQTPIFENYFAGGYSTLRGFSFRGASPKVGDVQVGGELMFLGALEYVFPLTADEMLRGVAFVDYGTVEQDPGISSENFRVAPGLGLRVSVPALGPAPLAFDFAYPINYADSDDRQVFSFFMGFTR